MGHHIFEKSAQKLTFLDHKKILQKIIMAKPSIEKALHKARNAFNSGITNNVNFRIRQLNNLHRMLTENENMLINAITEDLRKPYHESLLYEIQLVLNDLECMKQNIRAWVKPVSAKKHVFTVLDKVFIQYEPYGVVLVLSAWNYPLVLSLLPLMGAVTAGNCVILKPSEFAPHTAAILEELIPQYLDPDCYHVVTGDVEKTREILKEKFDYIFCTSSARVGQLVREASNKYLTPCTLELGGKSPVYIDGSVNLKIACRRILWGKLINTGQFCVSPDYLLCTKPVQDKLIPVLKEMLEEFYGMNPKSSPDLGRILNENHYRRLVSLMKDGDIVIGGECDESSLYIAPTVITNVKLSDPIMQEEIFGPLLPIILVESPDEAIDIINKKEKPLTLSVYSTDKCVVRNFLNNTSSGSVCVNDSSVNPFFDSLPFGGVGKSGMGAYHGKYSFETFSHKKAVVMRSYSALVEVVEGRVRYPPYDKEKLRFYRELLKRYYLIHLPIKHTGVFIGGMFFAWIIMKLYFHICGTDYS